MKINNNSEWERLKVCVLHRPGRAFTNIDPLNLKHFLVEDLVSPKKARAAVDSYAAHLKKHGVEVLYIEKMLAEVLDHQPHLRQKLVSSFMEKAEVKAEYVKPFGDLLSELDNQSLIDRFIHGTGVFELNMPDIKNRFEYVTEPLVNMLFQRDPAFAIGNCICISQMTFPVRKLEALLTKFLYFNHERFKDVPKITFEDSPEARIEGGDVMVLKNNHVFIGLSERSNLSAIRLLAKKLFAIPGHNITTISAIDMLKERSAMHLDTVFTQVDQNAFNLYESIFSDPIDIVVLTRDGETKRNIVFREYLKELFGEDMLIICPPNDGDVFADR